MKKLYLFIFACIMYTGLFAQPLGWNHAQSVSVTENSGANVYNYQLKIIFDSQTLISAGQMNSDGSDLRFGTLCDTANLYYWIESGINTPTTVVWVRIDTLLASQTRTVFMFYGNTSATSNSTVAGTFNGPNSATDSVASGGAGGVSNSQRGFRFSPNVDILVTSLGKREPTGTIRYVTLFDFATQAILQQIQVGGPAAQYSYSNLTNPVWLTTGTQYVLELYQGSGDGYYFGTSSQIGQHLTYLDMRYCNSCTQNTFPTNTLTNYHYGYPDLWYYTKLNVTPAPTYSIAAGPALSVSLGPDTTFCVSGVLDAGNPGSSYTWTPAASSQTINVNSSGTYAVLVTNAQNCVATDTVNIVVSPNPVVSLGNDSAFCAGNATILDAGPGYTYLWNDGSTTQTLNVTTSGNYSVIITDANACAGADTVAITVHSLPGVIGFAVPNVICLGDSVNFSSTGAVSYSWNNGIVNGANVVNASGSFVVTGTDGNNCVNTDTVTVTVNPLPTVGFNFTTDSVCINYAPIVLSGGSPAGGTYGGTGVSAGSFNPSIGTGSYIINYSYTDGMGCTNTATHVIFVSGCAGINSQEITNIHIYPNPTTGMLNIQLEETATNTVLNVYDMLGKNIYNTQLVTPHSIIQLNTLPGMYIIEISSGAKVSRRQIVVE